MATKFNFNGRLIKLPGAYSQIKSGINNPPLNFSYGNIVIVDTDDTGSYGGGSGVNGELQQNTGAIYGFDNVRDLRNFVGGGPIWDIAAPLFRPFGSGSLGASTVSIIKAQTTTAAIQTLNFVAVTAAGAVIFKTKYEGLAGNGVEGVTDLLTQGFAWTMEAGVIDSAKFVFKFYRGTYKGVDSQGLVLDSIALADSDPVLLATSPEVSLLSELVAWSTTDFDYNNFFEPADGTGITGDTIQVGDLTASSGNQLFAGGTASNAAADFDAAMAAIKDLDYTFILSLESGANVVSADNIKLQFHVESEAKYQKYLVVGGAQDKATFAANSIAAAATYNSARVMVVHGGCQIEDRTVGASGLRVKNSLYKAAFVLGRTCGLEPQIPITFKGIGIAGEVHKLTNSEREQALDAGVITTYFDTEIAGGIFSITQGVNTLQNNDFLVNQDGTSHLVSVERIAAQLNKEIEINAKNTLLGNQQAGPNRSTISPEIVAEWTENYLRRREATETEDNLILSFQDITVTIEQDAYCINYAFTPNFEVNKLFFTGLIIDPNIT